MDGVDVNSSQGSLLLRLASRYAARLKRSDYTLDPRIRSSHLVGVLLERIAMRVRGRLRFPLRRPAPFVGRGARLRATDMLRFGRGVTFGPGVYVDAMSVEGVVLGDNTSVGRNTRIECSGSLRDIGIGLRAGANVGLGTDCLYGAAGGIAIGDDTIVGNYVTFHSENHRADDLDRPIRDQGVTRKGIVIGRDCWIGAKATILDGVTLGDGTIIAAGSVVAAGDYEGQSIYGGVPARLLKRRAASA